MKSSIAGIFLAGSLLLPQYAGVKSSTDARDEIANISGKFKAENKELIAKVLKNGDMTKSTNTLSAQSSAAGDLFLELVPENEYGNIEKEKVAISKLISGLKSVERLSLKGMSHQDRIALHTGISDLIAQYDSVNQKTFDRKTFEDRTYVALLNLVILFDVDSLSELRRIIDPEKIKIINAAYSPAANSMQ